VGRITSITYKPADDEAGVGDYVRVPIGDANLVAGYGIEGDRKGGSAGRHLNILSQESVDEMIRDGYNGTPGAFGEQLIVEGIDVDGLGIGAVLRLGASAQVKVTETRRGCAKLESNQGMPKDRTDGKLGKMAEVTEGGDIQVGDEVSIVE
jgi:MOSC domain-containing protein YiiM